MSKEDDLDEGIRAWLRAEIASRGHGVKKDLAEHLGMSSQDGVTRIISEDPRRRLKKLPIGLLPKLEEFFGPSPLSLRPGERDNQIRPLPLPESLGDAMHQARRRRGASIRDLAQAIGTSIDDVNAWEDGASTPGTEQIEKIAAFLRIDANDLRRGTVVATDSDELGDATFVSDEMPRFVGPRDVEKLGVVAAGDDGDFEFNGKVANYVPRPKGLIGRPGVFSLEIISDSMYPAYRKFDPIFCDRLEPQIGDDVVIETFPENGASVGKAFVKRLKKRTNSTIVVEQFNPPKEITFDPYAIKHLWRVVPHRELHGL